MKEIYKQSFLYSLATGVYIALVAIFMSNGERIFGGIDSAFGGVAMLLLFTLSVLVVGSLLVGKPIFLYIDGQKKDAMKMLVANAGWLLFFFIIAAAVLIISK